MTSVLVPQPTTFQHASEEYRQLAGSKPLTLKSLLENPIQFVKSTRSNGVQEEDKVPYRAINQKSNPNQSTTTNAVASTSKSIPQATNANASTSTTTTTSSSKTIFPQLDLSPSWSRPYPIGSGLHNVGNTCFLNSALQCLLHTPPLVRYLEMSANQVGGHESETQCLMKQKKGFCMTCAMRSLVKQSFGNNRKRAYVPQVVTKNLKAIAKHFRMGRQEDSHEFLRFVVDAMQLSSLAGKSPKLTPSEKNQNPIHQLFGGQLRSRVHCTSCGHNSDTFDATLDLSLDLGNRAMSVKEGLDNLVRVDHLKGGNKYRCEKCKKLVNAEKQFTIDRAPLVLTIHLKRFTPTGRKVTGFIKYPEKLNLGGYMSDRSQNPSYILYALILHSGSGPHSGHYTSLVRAGTSGPNGQPGKFYEMNDDLVSPVQGGSSALSSKNAYVLFYVREKGDQLKNIISAGAAGGGGGGGGGEKKRKRDSSLGSHVGSRNGGGEERGEKIGNVATVERNQSNGGSHGSPLTKKPRSTSMSSTTTTSSTNQQQRAFSSGPQPPRILTASTPSSPKLSTATNPNNPFESNLNKSPSSSTPNPLPTPPPTSSAALSTSPTSKTTTKPVSTQDRLLEKVKQAKMDKIAAKKMMRQKEFQSRNLGHGGGGGGSGKMTDKGKSIVGRMKGRSNKPRLLS